MSTTLEKALSYAIELSFSVFPVHGVMPDGKCTCGNPDCTPKQTGKHPATRNGLKDATKDPNRITNLFTSSKPYNLAVATGPASNIFVVDIDGMEGENSLAELEAKHGKLPKTLTSMTGRGRHIIYRYPPDTRVKNSTSKVGEKIDIRGDGGYIIIPPSLHQTGAFYQWDSKSGWDIKEAPAWLLDAVEDKAPEAPESTHLDYTPRYENDNWSDQDVEEMLTFIDADLHYDDWIAVGFALKDGGYPLAIFNNWSSRGSKYPGIAQIDKHWKSFHAGGGITMGTLVNMAMVNGWKPSADRPDSPLQEMGRAAAAQMFANRARKFEVPPAANQEPVKEEPKPIKKEDPPKEHSADDDGFPEFIPGIIGDTVNWIISNAILPQPELAMINVIAALGALFGRRYASPMDTRTNVYMVGLAGTGAGKGHSKKMVKKIFLETGLTDFLGGETIVSAAGLLTEVSKQASQLMHLDEFGMLLGAIMDKRGASHLTLASKVITELYSNSNEKYIGGQYADVKKERVVIASPNLCIAGISTMEKYVQGLNRDAIASGELNRFIIIKTKTDMPKRRRGVFNMQPPSWLISAWKELKPPSNYLNNGMIEPEVMRVEWPGLEDRIYDIADFEDSMRLENKNGCGALWGRYRENVIKIAMIIAIARNPIKPEIRDDDLTYGERIAYYSIKYMSEMAMDNLADSQHEKDCNDIIAVIKSHKGGVSKRELSRRTQRMDKKQRESAIGDLIEQGKIETVIEADSSKRGPAALKYIICQ